MFKALIMSLAIAASANATVNNATPMEELNGGLNGPALIPVGTPTYALNNALTGSASAAIDLSGTAGLMVCITSTGAANVTVYYSNTALSQTGGAFSYYTVNANGCYPVKQGKGRYVSFVNSSNQASNRVSVNYLAMVAPAIAVTANVAGVTYTTLVSDTYMAGYVTTTAAGTAGRGGSYTAVALTGTYSQNVTVAAGVNAPCIVTIYPGNSTPTAGAYWNLMPAWFAPTTPLAVSTTPLVFTAGIGDVLNLSVTAATNPVTYQVRYAPIY